MTRASARRWSAPEVVQTSSMDCGPAALKCLLAGFGIEASYGRLREACQTDVDGTSIDTIETVARQLGLSVEQVMLPVDHVLSASAGVLPAMLTVRRPDGSNHFVVVWRRVGDWLQVMDPATGRRWTRVASFLPQVLHHVASVPAADWRTWAGSDEALAMLRSRMSDLGLSGRVATALIDEAFAMPGWRGAGALEAAVRLGSALLEAGGVKRGEEACALVATLARRASQEREGADSCIPAAYWSVSPDPEDMTALRLGGAVLMRVSGRGAQAPRAELSTELAAALAEPPVRPLRTVWNLMREDGLAGPLALAGVMGIAAGALLLEALLFRGMFDVSVMLGTVAQRVGAVAGLVAFVLVLTGIQLPITIETLRLGRHLELRLRMALLAKLPRLSDRYFQSRPVSDMADRGHAIHAVREVPALGLACLQTLFELAFTLAGVALVAPDSIGLGALVVGCAMLLPLVLQPLLNERDLGVRNHAGALAGFYLDALLGLVPVRAHRAEHNLRRAHEGLLVEWTRACRSWLGLSLAADSVQALVCLGLAGWMLVDHFARAGGIVGTDLLLVFWTLKLPALGSNLAALAHQYPAQRNALMRLLEPLHAPEAAEAAATSEAAPHAGPSGAAARPAAGTAAAVDFKGVNVIAGGHPVLREVSLSIGAGEHVAVIGVSGAGKSSLLGLLLGWHTPAAGGIMVDGVTLDALTLERLRRGTAWVDPAVALWNQSLADNLGYASADGAVSRFGPAIDAARLRGVVQKLPRGLQTLLGEGGGLLSGGEGQRVRLARALLMEAPRLVLLDEPFRGLDRSQRAALLGEARAWWRASTLLCVTHDVGETQGFDRVLVVEGGRVVEDGSPQVLLSSESRYRALLEAERRLAEQVWGGGPWRRLRVEGGRVVEAGARS